MRKLFAMLVFAITVLSANQAHAITQSGIVELIRAANTVDVRVFDMRIIHKNWHLYTFKWQGVRYEVSWDRQYNVPNEWSLTMEIKNTVVDSIEEHDIEDANADGVVESAPLGFSLNETQAKFDQAIVAFQATIASARLLTPVP